MTMRPFLVSCWLPGLFVLAAGCSSAEMAERGAGGANRGRPTLDAAVLDGGGSPGIDGGIPVDGGDGHERPGAGRDGGPDTGGADLCLEAGLACGAGQRCDTDGDGPRCADNSCEDLACPEGEDCRPVEEGGGWVCVAAGCVTNADCSEAAYCDGTTCRLDTCEALERTCDGDTVLACDSAGGRVEPLFSCGSGGHFVSECLAEGRGDARGSSSGQAACSCEGDWDCPAFTVCDVGVCTGTGVAPTCTLPAVDFSSVPPALELHWGGDAPGDTARDGTLPREMAPAAPWPAFTHVLNTPIVANLDDDNGDGLINELDFPEIIFMAHQGNHAWEDAVVRAIHGGGPEKGADYFARCADLLWRQGDPPPTGCDSESVPTADTGAPVAVGDLDGDGVPEIVVPLEDDTFEILDNTGALIYALPSSWDPSTGKGETIAIANLDHRGHAELIVGPHVFVLGDDDGGNLIVTHVLTGQRSSGINDGVSFMACPADLDQSRAGLEISVGTTLYALPATLDACATPPCTGTLDVVWHAPAIGAQGDDLNDSDGTDDGLCAVADIWGADFGVAPGPDNPPDGEAEVILIAHGHLVILEGATGTLIDIRSLGGGRGGAPNVDDFDGDGYMEVASALEDYYVVIDLQAPDATHCPVWNDVLPRVLDAGGTDVAGSCADDGDCNQSNGYACRDGACQLARSDAPRTPGGRDGDGACQTDDDCNSGAVCGSASVCVCLQSGWRRGSDDDSSRATSSSVFDFNGDGSAEVVYNDECDLRVYRGSDGAVLYSEASRSRTGTEHPVVADVDNDGNAEIVVGSNNAAVDRCDEDGANPTGVNGLRVFGDPTDTWAAARRIWNQQSYHVTQVTESGAIPRHEAESWTVLNGRAYNTYRSQPRSFGVAPDLTVTGISLSAADGGCATDLLDRAGEGESTVAQVSLEVRNLGGLRVGPGVVVSLVGLWEDEGLEAPLSADDSGLPLTVTMESSLEPGASFILTLRYDVSHNAPERVPDRLRAIVDAEDSERECDEDNNSLDYVPSEDVQQVELSLTVDDVSGCPDATVKARVSNEGSVAVDGFTIAWFAGDPSQGGSELGETTVAETLAAGTSMEVMGTLPDFPERSEVTVYGVLDPDQHLDDCARGNNTARSPAPHGCLAVLQ